MSERKYWLDDFANVKKLIKVFVVICVALFAVDFFYHRHAERSWEEWYGFYAFYGFGACVLLVLIAKEMRKVVMRKEDYYDE